MLVVDNNDKFFVIPIHINKDKYFCFDKTKPMKPITFEFLEKPSETEFKYSVIEYDNELNLSVDKTTRLPSIDSLNMETETFTKTGGEASDSDSDFQMDTATRTYTQLESTDSDADIHSLIQLMETSTLTETSEVVDSDDDIK